jgi:hypothetical protein
MSVREKLNDKKLGTGVAIGLLVLALLVLGHYILSHWTPKADVMHSYYTDDDGQTFFEDSVYKFPPFDHDGKTAYLATIGVTGGHKFVAYVSRYKPEDIKQLQAEYDRLTKNGEPLQHDMLTLIVRLGANMEVKLPGSGHPWIPAYKTGSLDVRGPDGKLPEQVLDGP